MLAIKKISNWILYAIAAISVLIVALIAIVRFAIYPNIDRYKADIAAEATKALNQKVTIGNIQTGWDGLSPHFIIQNVDVFDAQNRSALHLNNIETTLSWTSIPMMQPRLSHLLVRNPKLIIRRQADGTIFLAGINLTGESNPVFTNWLLSQPEVSVQGANLVWLDEMRKAPALSLNKLDLTLKNPAWRTLFGQHLYKLSAQPSVGTKYPIEVNGSFFGRDTSQMHTWHGKAYLQADEADLTAWKPWLDYPLNLESGVGDSKIWLEFANSEIHHVRALVSLTNFSAQMKSTVAPLVAEHFSGQLTWDKSQQNAIFKAEDMMLKTTGGLNIEDGYAHVTQTIKNKKPWFDVAIKIDQFNIASAQQFVNFIPVPPSLSEALTALAPRGELKDIRFGWQGEWSEQSHNTDHYHLKSEFTGLSIHAYNNIPGFENLSGQVDADQNGGNLKLASTNASLDFKDILRWPIPATELKGKIAWKIHQGKAKIMASDLFITSPHITGTLNASYDMAAAKGGYLDLRGDFGKGNAKYAPFYYPIILGAPTLHWLDTSILAGKAEDVHLTIKGSLADFPYVTKQNKLDPKLGVFRVTAKISDALLEYGTDWPLVEGLALDMLFEGKRMELNAYKGHVFANKIIKSKTEIPQLDADWPMLLITSEVEGSVMDGVRFVNESPVKQVALGFTEGLKTAGKGKLHLELKIPMQDIEAAKFKGAYKITDGTIYANADVGLPELSKINGTLNFTEKSLSAQNVSTEIVGGASQFSLNTGSDKIIHINAGGHINDAGIKKIASNPFINALQGSTDWTGSITIKKPLVDVDIQSNLVGMAVQLPAPLGKSTSQAMPLDIDKNQFNPHEDSTDIHYGNLVAAKILRKEQGGALVFDRGDVAINMPAERPSEAGLAVRGKLDNLDADEWLALFNKPASQSDKTPLEISKADFAIQKFEIFNRKLNALKVIAKPSATGLQMAIESQEVTGDAEWQSAKPGAINGKIIARLKNLTVPSNADAVSNAAKKDFKKLDSKYPALDVTAENFQVGSKLLGALELVAFESNEDWLIQKLKISSADYTLTADGSWHNWTRSPNTHFKFNLKADNVGKTLKRFGQPDMILDGTAEITGQLHWPGSPHEFDPNGLDGNFKLEAAKGQVLKAQPGVGRLLGLLSLQSLPRRLSLDFRDLFSEGFAFDKISATAKIDNGIMRSNDFFMTGPAAEAKIKGETNLQKETQNLRIKVIPHISDSLSLAALAGGPIAGAAAFVAQKILKDPFNKIVQSEYVITGTWDNPQEIDTEKESAKQNTGSSPLIQ